jgi:hypothetical protein
VAACEEGEQQTPEEGDVVRLARLPFAVDPVEQALDRADELGLQVVVGLVELPHVVSNN